MKTFCSVTVPATSARLKDDVSEFLQAVARLRAKKRQEPLSLPLTVRIVRTGPRLTTLPGAACWAIHDAVGEFFGVTATSPKITWLVEFEAGHDATFRIEFGKEQAIDAKEFAL